MSPYGSNLGRKLGSVGFVLLVIIGLIDCEPDNTGIRKVKRQTEFLDNIDNTDYGYGSNYGQNSFYGVDEGSQSQFGDTADYSSYSSQYSDSSYPIGRKPNLEHDNSRLNLRKYDDFNRRRGRRQDEDDVPAAVEEEKTEDTADKTEDKPDTSDLRAEDKQDDSDKAEADKPPEKQDDLDEGGWMRGGKRRGFGNTDDFTIPGDNNKEASGEGSDTNVRERREDVFNNYDYEQSYRDAEDYPYGGSVGGNGFSGDFDTTFQQYNSPQNYYGYGANSIGQTYGDSYGYGSRPYGPAKSAKKASRSRKNNKPETKVDPEALEDEVVMGPLRKASNLESSTSTTESPSPFGYSNKQQENDKGTIGIEPNGGFKPISGGELRRRKYHALNQRKSGQPFSILRRSNTYPLKTNGDSERPLFSGEPVRRRRSPNRFDQLRKNRDALFPNFYEWNGYPHEVEYVYDEPISVSSLEKRNNGEQQHPGRRLIRKIIRPIIPGTAKRERHTKDKHGRKDEEISKTTNNSKPPVELIAVSKDASASTSSTTVASVTATDVTPVSTTSVASASSNSTSITSTTDGNNDADLSEEETTTATGKV